VGREGEAVTRSGSDAVNAYIAKQPTEVQAVLQRVRRIIRRALPGAEETIGYQRRRTRASG
jgi:hypothetical protein